MDDDTIGTGEACLILKIDPRSVARLCRTGKLTARRISQVWIIDRKSVEEYASRAVGKSLNDPTRRKPSKGTK